ncbi:LPXTG cell wall anchor domain-containing protein [Secundilactobacillus silagei]|uniref:LPXTG cell wall anchor domain-containing protein n=1 Tax=Secundilactobacillus silagei TaxID=1293415 RepID=UPI0006D0E04C|nr:LPXTG cell wall anchor domain-containing protein [Secundilactobacillus silagei]
MKDQPQGYQEGYTSAYEAGKASYDTDYQNGQVAGQTDGTANKATDNSKQSAGYQDGYVNGQRLGEQFYNNAKTEGAVDGITTGEAGQAVPADLKDQTQGYQDGFNSTYPDSYQKHQVNETSTNNESAEDTVDQSSQANKAIAGSVKKSESDNVMVQKQNNTVSYNQTNSEAEDSSKENSQANVNNVRTSVADDVTNQKRVHSVNLENSNVHGIVDGQYLQGRNQSNGKADVNKHIVAGNKQQSANKLPQTNVQQGNTASLLGLVMLLGSLGVIDLKRKKRQD